MQESSSNNAPASALGTTRCGKGSARSALGDAVLRTLSSPSDSDGLVTTVHDTVGARIAVVGNGVVNGSDREAIGRFDVAVRFNSLDNRSPGERVDIHYLRFDPGAMTFHGLAVAQKTAPSLLGLVWERRYAVVVDEIVKAIGGRAIRHVSEDFQGLAYPGASLGYPPYEEHDRKVPSTGYFAVHDLLRSVPAAEIHLFGFSWKGWRWHDWEFERSVMESIANVPNSRLILHSSPGA